jgi:hypothetical protein
LGEHFSVNRKREFLRWHVVEDRDGNRAVYSIYKQGRSFWVVTDKGYEHLVHPTAPSVEAEIGMVFHCRVIKTAASWQGYPSLI